MPGGKPPQDPITTFAFALEIQGITEAWFREASGFSSENDVIEYKEQGPKGQTILHKIPGTLKFGNIQLKRGITSNLELWKWRKKVIDGQIEAARVDGSVVGYDEDGNEKIRFNFKRGWPCKWEASGLNAQGNEPIIESIEIACEYIERMPS
ncbi:MAG: phage tail protein [Chloroflexi bacterium]|nr:phage tail protein [Chloroflexota bacterium]